MQVQLICDAGYEEKTLQSLQHLQHILLQAGQRKFPKETDEDEKENVKVKERRDENVQADSWGGLKLASSYINGRLDDAADAVVLEPLDSEYEEAAVAGDGRPFGALAQRPGNQVGHSVDKAI